MPNIFGDLYYNSYRYNRDECGMTHEQMCKLLGDICGNQQMEEFRKRYEQEEAA